MLDSLVLKFWLSAAEGTATGVLVLQAMRVHDVFVPLLSKFEKVGLQIITNPLLPSAEASAPICDSSVSIEDPHSDATSPLAMTSSGDPRTSAMAKANHLKLLLSTSIQRLVISTPSPPSSCADISLPD